MTGYYPQFFPPQGELRPLTGAEHAAAWAEYKQACKRAYYRPPLSASWHIFWLLITICTFGVGAIGWIIHAAAGSSPVLRDGAPAPVWPPPGYYIPRR